MDNQITFIDEATVKQHLRWPLVIQAVDQALRSVSTDETSESAGGDASDNPVAVQPARSFTHVPGGSDGGILLTMPGYIGNYRLTNGTENESTTFNTLACKLVTSFMANAKRTPPLPTIAATILLFDSLTGFPKAILAATEITTWRTVAASIVATKCLWFDRHSRALPSLQSETEVSPEGHVAPRLAVVGCGVQGRMHAIGMLSTFTFSRIRLWNRDQSKAVALAAELRALFGGSAVTVEVAENVVDCVELADIIVTATYASSPLIRLNMLKKGAHINAVGAGVNHHSELADDVYARSAIYVDSKVSANVELATLSHPILGQVGDVLLGRLAVPDQSQDQFTVFHSMGMAVEDATVAEMVFQNHQIKNVANN